MLFLVLTGREASALEPELDLWERTAPACQSLDAFSDKIRVPILEPRKGSRNEPGINRVFQKRFIRVRHAMDRFRTLAKLATCLDYTGGWDVESRLSDLESLISSETVREVEKFARDNERDFALEWRDLSLSKLESELSAVASSSGPMAGICHPPEVDSDFYAPVPSAGVSADERKVYERLTGEAESLQKSIRAQAKAFAAVLEALEGEDCLQTARLFLRMIDVERTVYLEHRDQQLGRLLRHKLNWKKMGSNLAQ